MKKILLEQPNTVSNYDPWDLNNVNDITPEWQRFLGIDPNDPGNRQSLVSMKYPNNQLTKNKLGGNVYNQVDGLDSEGLKQFNLMPRWYQQTIMGYDPSARQQAVKGYEGSIRQAGQEFSQTGDKALLRLATAPYGRIQTAIKERDPSKILPSYNDFITQAAKYIINKLDLSSLFVTQLPVDKGTISLAQFLFLFKNSKDSLITLFKTYPNIFNYDANKKTLQINVSEFKKLFQQSFSNQNLWNELSEMSSAIIMEAVGRVLDDNRSIIVKAMQDWTVDVSDILNTIIPGGAPVLDVFNKITDDVRVRILTEIKQKINLSFLQQDLIVDDMVFSLKKLGDTISGTGSYFVPIQSYFFVENDNTGQIILGLVNMIKKQNMLSGSTVSNTLKSILLGENNKMKFDDMIVKFLNEQQTENVVTPPPAWLQSTISEYDPEQQQQAIQNYQNSVSQQSLNPEGEFDTEKYTDALGKKYSGAMNTLAGFNQPGAGGMGKYEAQVRAVANKFGGTGLDNMVLNGTGVMSSAGGKAQMAASGGSLNPEQQKFVDGLPKEYQNQAREFLIGQNQPSSTTSNTQQTSQQPQTTNTATTQPPVNTTVAQTTTPPVTTPTTTTPRTTPMGSSSQDYKNLPNSPAPRTTPMGSSSQDYKNLPNAKNESVFGQMLGDKLNEIILQNNKPKSDKTFKTIDTYVSQNLK